MHKNYKKYKMKNTTSRITPKCATPPQFYNYQDYEIEIKEDDENGKIFLDIIDKSKKDEKKGYYCEVHLPNEVYKTDLHDSFGKELFEVKEENGKLIINVLFYIDGKEIISNFFAEPTKSKKPDKKLEEDVKDNNVKMDSNKSKKEGDSIAPSNLNHFMKNNLIGNEENPAIINLNVINDPNLNKYERIYLLSKNLFNTIKHDEKYIPGSFVSDDEMECDIKEKGEESSPYFPILVLKKKLEKNGIIALVERHCTQPELSKELLQMIVSGLGFLPVYEFHLNYGPNRNKEILSNKTEEKKYIEQMKEYFSRQLLIDKKLIFITDLRKGSIKFNAFFGKELDDAEIDRLKTSYNDGTFVDEGIKFGGLLLKYCKLSQEMFDVEGNNFTGWAPKGEKRGKELYDPPENNGKYYGFGLKVSGQYDNGDNTWLGMENKDGEFCVAYHGVGSLAAEPLPIVGAIMNDKKFIAGRRQACKNYNDKRHNGKKCGEGAYFTPIIKIAEGFAGNCSVCGNNYKAIFMCRVNREKIREPLIQIQGLVYWILSGEPDEVRPYRIIIVDISQADNKCLIY